MQKNADRADYQAEGRATVKTDSRAAWCRANGRANAKACFFPTSKTKPPEPAHGLMPGSFGDIR